MRILLAEDSGAMRRLVHGALEGWGYEVEEATDGLQALAALDRDNGPRLAIVDWVMPGIDGLELCRRVRARARSPYVYVLLLTCKGGVRSMVEALDAGADDFVAKPFDPDELRARLRSGRRVLDLQEALLEAQATFAFQATHDALTGVWNRAGILAHLDRELARARREGSSVTVALADLDHFKQVNDTFGHAAGDAVLREAARRIRRELRPYDALGRYGGEEFLIIAPGGPGGQRAIAERVRQAVSRSPVATESGPVSLTMSVGAVVTAGDARSTAAQLIDAADRALYRAKRRGRDRTELAR